MESRPKVGEVVAHLEEAAAGWDRLMPPRSLIRDVASGPEELPDLEKHREFRVLILP